MRLLYRTLKHILFWLGSGLLLTLFLGHRTDNFQGAVSFVLVLLPIATLTSYAFNYWLFPRYLLRRDYGRFTLFGFMVVVISIYLQMMVVLFTFIYVASYEIENMIPGTVNVINLGVGMYLIVAVSGVIYLLKRFSENEEERELVVRVNRQNRRMLMNEIQYVESLDNYVKIHLKEETLITKERISSLSDRLGEGFIRVHRSYLINRKAITSYTREQVIIGDVIIPISRTYKSRFLREVS